MSQPRHESPHVSRHETALQDASGLAGRRCRPATTASAANPHGARRQLTLALALLLGACSSNGELPRVADQDESGVQAGASAEPVRADAPKAEPRSRQESAQQAAPAAPQASVATARLAEAVAPGLAQEARAQHELSAPMPSPLSPAVVDRERYAELTPNPVQQVLAQPVSTFSVDVDTGAYSNVRRFLSQGRLPPSDAVRVEEMINYFDYDYPRPTSLRQPFSVHTELALAPWNADRWLLQVGLKGFEVPREALPASNLVFLLDVSGSMHSADKLPLVKYALGRLVQQLRPADRVAIVVYAGAAGLVLPATAGDQQDRILAALDALQAGGSTNGGAGIELAYRVARENYIEGGVNRVILATDGDFNVGTVDQSALEDLVSRQRSGGIALTTLGFGQGNYNDHLAERLANLGDGNHAYIDTEREAHKVLVQELGANLLTIARDVKIQIEFNPAVVAEYRLIGYENRLLAREDFDNDAVDAGEIGAGHSVTALYELTPTGSAALRLPPLRYGATQAPTAARQDSAELGFLRLRWKQPDADRSELLQQAIPAPQQIGAGSARLRFAAAVAGYGEALRGGKYLDGYDLGRIQALAAASSSDDPYGLQAEFIDLVGRAQALLAPQRGISQIAD